jgi:fatty acid desaturase
MKARSVMVEGRDAMPSVEPSWSVLGRYGRTNLLVTFLQAMTWAALLTVIDASSLHWTLRLAGLVLFCIMMQGVFTMLHEFCHRNAHCHPRLNYLIGWVASTLFGTAPTLLQVQHWGHHRRNRTESERAEFIHEDESPWAKTFQYYAAILGGIWLGCLLFPLIAPLLPYSISRWLARHKRFNTFAAGFDDFDAIEWRRMRVEGISCFFCWGSLIWLGPWHWQTVAVAYTAFAFSWSSLQWVYHLNTPVHVVEGAYNLRLPVPMRLLFLNFNYNLTHHREPSLPWQELCARSSQNETQPLWYRYIRIFCPPMPFPKDPSLLEKRYF